MKNLFLKPRRGRAVFRGTSDNRLFRSMVEHAGDAIVLVDARCIVRYENSAASAMFGYRPEDIENRSAFDFVIAEDRARAEEAFSDLVSGASTTRRLRLQVRHADGSLRTAQVTASTHPGSRRKTHVVVNIRDVSTEVEQNRRIADEELRFRTLVGSVEDVVFLLDRDGRYTGAYGRWLERAGMTEGTFLGKTVREIFGPDEAAVHEKSIERALQGKPETYEWAYHGPEGTRTMQTTLSPIMGEGGATSALVGVGRDITEHRNLSEDMRLMSAALEQAPACVVVTDREGAIQYVNPRFVELSGYRLEEVLGKNPRMLQSGLTPHQVYRSLWAELVAGRTWAGEFCNKKKSGELYWESAVIAPVVAQDGTVTHYVAVKQDITQQKKAELAAEESHRRFQKAFQSSPIPMVLSTLEDGRVLEANQAALWTLGFTNDDLSGRTTVDAAMWPSVEARMKIMRHVRQEGSIQDVVLHVRRRDGREIELLASFDRMDMGGEDCVLVHLLDMTEQRRAEQAVKESEANYRMMFQGNPQPMWAYEVDTLQFLAVNDAAVHSYGYSAEEFLRMKSTDLLPEEDAARMQGRLVNGSRGVDEVGVWRHRKKDGSIVDAQITSHAMYFDGSRARVEIVQDVTERLRTERSLQRSEDRLRRLFEDTPVGIVVADGNGLISSCNGAFARMFGYSSPEEVRGIDLRKFQTTEGTIDQMLHRAKEAQLIQNEEFMLAKRDGKPIDVLANIVGRFDEHAHCVGIQAYFIDESAQKALERQLIHAQKMESLGTLAGGIAHDFNNVLGIIFAHLSLLPLTIGQSEKFSAAIDAMSKASERGAGLVRQLMTFARMNEPARELVRVVDIIDEIASLLRETFPKVITFERTIEGPSPVINADPTQMHQILLNLCVNARDAMVPCGGTIRIHTCSWSGPELSHRLPEAEGGDYAEITVSDTGCGIGEDVIPRIFEPFFSTKPKGRGTGLGLSTVYGIVKAHHGFIDVESTVGKGTKFHLFLPATPLPSSGPVTPPPKTEIPHGKETLLLVDDEESLREAFRAVLESRGYRVLCASDGEEAIHIFSEHAHSINLVLTDFGLPRRSGLEVVAHVKKIDPSVKVIVVTGYLDAEQRAQLRDLKVDAIMMKPTKPGQVVQQVRTLFDRP